MWGTLACLKFTNTVTLLWFVHHTVKQKGFVAERCSIKNLKNSLEKSFYSFFEILVQRTSFFSLCSLMQLKWLLKHLFRPVLYAHICLSLPIILSILSVSEILFEARELFPDCSLICFIFFPNAHSNHYLFTVHLILNSHSNCLGHSFVYSFFKTVVVIA